MKVLVLGGLADTAGVAEEGVPLKAIAEAVGGRPVGVPAHSLSSEGDRRAVPLARVMVDTDASSAATRRVAPTRPSPLAG